jgi:hypothetical protein
MIKNSLVDVEMPPLDSNGGGLSVLICTDYTFQHNWMAYSAWYSVSQKLPEAKVTIISPRPKPIETWLYHWVPKISDLRYHLHKNIGVHYGLPYLNKLYGVYIALKEGLVKQPLVVLEADMMAVGDFSPLLLQSLRESKFATNPCPFNVNFAGKPVGPIWFFNGIPLEKVAEAINTVGVNKGKEYLDLLALSRVFGDEVTVLEDLGNEAHEQGVTTFTHYKERCGNFSRQAWAKGKTLPPFNVSYALQTSDLSLNERKVLALWHQMAGLYEAVNHVKM